MDRRANWKTCDVCAISIAMQGQTHEKATREQIDEHGMHAGSVKSNTWQTHAHNRGAHNAHTCTFARTHSFAHRHHIERG